MMSSKKSVFTSLMVSACDGDAGCCFLFSFSAIDPEYEMNFSKINRKQLIYFAVVE